MGRVSLKGTTLAHASLDEDRVRSEPQSPLSHRNKPNAEFERTILKKESWQKSKSIDQIKYTIT